MGADKIHYKVADFTPYEGWEVKGVPVLTMLRSNMVVENGKKITQGGSE